MEHKTFINGLARQLSVDTNQTEIMVDNLINVIKDNLCNLDTIAIPGFGKICSVKSNEHIETDSKGHRMLYPPHIDIEFTVGSKLKKRL